MKHRQLVDMGLGMQQCTFIASTPPSLPWFSLGTTRRIRRESALRGTDSQWDLPPWNDRRVQRQDRRGFIQSCFSTLVFGPATCCSAACLSGDLRTECIGVYKLPIDAPESDFVSTPAQLSVYAPDLNWVPPVKYPTTYNGATQTLKNNRIKLDEAKTLVSQGDLEGAGLNVLEIVPSVTAAVTVIRQQYTDASNAERNEAMKVYMQGRRRDLSMDSNPSTNPQSTKFEMANLKIENASEDLFGALGECDILIGQALRGDLGVIAPAQIAILQQFTLCAKEFDALMRVVPEKFLAGQ